MKKRFALPAFLLFLTCSGLAQDVQLSQFHVADMLLNPALTGSQHRNRFMVHQRWQWPSLQGNYNTGFFSFDKFFSKNRIGLGSYLSRDVQGAGIIESLVWKVQGSYEIDLNEKYSMRFGMQAGLFKKQLNDDGLIYPDQVTPDGINTTQASENLGGIGYSQPDFGSGVVLFTEKFWLSASMFHLNRPKQRFVMGEERYPMRGSFIVGYKFPLGTINPMNFTGYVKEFYLFPVIHYKFQGKSDQLEIGADMINDQLRLGLWYRGIPFKKYNTYLHNNESFVLLAGWRFKNLEFVYSYDVVISRLQRAQTGGAHEIHLSYIWPLHIKKKNFKKLPCPDFQKSIEFSPY